MPKQPICIINTGTDWLKDLKEHLIALNQTYTVIDLEKMAKTRFDQFSAVIITGSNTMLTELEDLPTYLKQFRFLRAIKTPVLGICLGHQIMGAVYGAEVRKGNVIDGEEDIEVVDRTSLFNHMREIIPFREQHTESITLPKEFKLLAESSGCTNEAMQHKYKPLFGVQFHPEVSGEYGRELLSNFISQNNV